MNITEYRYCYGIEREASWNICVASNKLIKIPLASCNEPGMGECKRTECIHHKDHIGNKGIDYLLPQKK